MSTPFSLFDPNSPQLQAYVARNPTGFFASIFGNQSRPSDPNIGSNNGGVAIGSNGNTPTTQVGGPNMNPGGSNNADGFSGVPTGAPRAFASDLPARHQADPGMYRYSNAMVGQMGFRRNPGENHSVAQNTGMTQEPTSFAAGGMMTEDGGAMRPGQSMPPSAGTGRTLPSARFNVQPQEPQLGAAGPPKMSSQQIEQEVQNFMKAQPQEVQKIQQVITLAMQTGELTIDELNQAVQLAKVALANPASYPQIRQFAIQNGLGTEQDLPEEMDQGLLYALILAGKAMQQAGSRADVPTSGNAMAGQGPAPTGPKGGILPEYSKGGKTGSKAHIAKLHPREYVIPEEAVLFYGTDKFAKMIEKARNPDGNEQQ